MPFYRAKKITKSFKTKIGDICKEITNGIDIRNFYNEGTLYLRVGDIKRSQINLLTAKTVKETLEDVPKKVLIKDNDILMTRKGTPGITTITTKLDEKCIIGTEIIKIRIKEDAKFLPEFIFAFLNSELGFLQIEGKLTGTVSRGINHPSLKSIRVPSVSLKEQEKIAGLVTKAKDKHIEAFNKIEKAKKIFIETLNLTLSFYK